MAEQRLLAVSPNLPCAMDRQEWSLDDYHIRQTLYNGYAAQVYTAMCKYSGMEVVLKVYHDVDKAPDVAQHEMYREVAIQSGLQHPNVVHLFGAFEEGDTLVLVQEYAPNGDLLALMQSHGGRVDEATVVKAVLRPLLGSLMYLHRWGIVHRDVKPENVLFAADGTIKLADFGLAINMVEERPVSRVGTLDYMAPEVLRCPIKQSMAMAPGPSTPARYGFATDVWAVGIVTFELLTGLPPYASDCRYQAESRICSSVPPLFPQSISPLARDFILRMLAPQPGDRPTVRQLLEHPWMVNPEACVAQARAQLHRSLMSLQHGLPSPVSSYNAMTASLPYPVYSHGHSAPQPHLVHHQQAPHQAAFPTSSYSVDAAPSSAAICIQNAPHSETRSPGSANAATEPMAVSSASTTQYGSATNLSHPTQASSNPGSGREGVRSPPAAASPSTSSDQAQTHHFQAQTSGPLSPTQTAAAALSVDQQLRVLQQQQLLDLSKLPLDQIQGMIQKLQQAMQLAVVQQQQQQRGDSGASAVDAAQVALSAGVVVPLASQAATSCDVQMDDVRSCADEVYVMVRTSPAAAAAAAAAVVTCSSSSTGTQMQQHAAPAPVAVPMAASPPSTASPFAGAGSLSADILLDRASAGGAASASTHAGAVGSASCASVATCYGSLCASRRSTVDAAPPQRTDAPAALLEYSQQQQQQQLRQQQVPTPRDSSADQLAAKAATLHGSPVVLALAPGDAAAMAMARLSGGGHHHEGDGLVYVSIGSSRKALGGAAQCEPAQGGAVGVIDVSAWVRQFAAP